jgi:hypothetical protein
MHCHRQGTNRHPPVYPGAGASPGRYKRLQSRDVYSTLEHEDTGVRHQRQGFRTLTTNSHGITIQQLLRVPPRPTLMQLNDLAIERGMDPLWPDGVGRLHFSARSHAAILALWRAENPDAATKPVQEDKRAGRGGEVPSISNRIQRERLQRDAAGRTKIGTGRRAP